MKIRMSVACGLVMLLLCSHDVREARGGIPVGVKVLAGLCKRRKSRLPRENHAVQ